MTKEQRTLVLKDCRRCLRANDCDEDPGNCGLMFTEEMARAALKNCVDAIKYLGSGYGDIGFMTTRDEGSYLRGERKAKGKLVATETGETRDQDRWSKSVYFLDFEDFLKELGIIDGTEGKTKVCTKNI
jgi:predicted deacylase